MGGIDRRTLLKGMGALTAAGALASLRELALVPERADAKGGTKAAPLPEIQFDIGAFVPPPVAISGIKFAFGPVHTLFLTATIGRRPSGRDKERFEAGLAAVEKAYPFSPAGVFTFVSYGVPYFEKLPGGYKGKLVSPRMPRLTKDKTRFAFEEAVPGPTDLAPGQRVTKPRFNVPVQIERNDVLITLRSDVLENLLDVQAWLSGGSTTLRGANVGTFPAADLFTWTSARFMFNQRGLPRQMAEAASLPYAGRIHPESPMWMGFADMVAGSAGPAPICTFGGNASAKLTDAKATDYFALAGVQHLSHVILDLREWYLANGTERDTPFDTDMGYLERVQYMYRPNNPPSFGNADQFTDGGGPTFLPNDFKGPRDAQDGLAGGSWQMGANKCPFRAPGHPVMGHVQCLQRSSRAPDGTPLHIRVDGPGFDSMDVPDGSIEPKLQFSAFVPTSEQFRQMRDHGASNDLADEFLVEKTDQGLEHRITATRRQNFLCPPRSKRSFPLVELA